MKVLSYKQPWAFLVAAGIKPIENRTWKLPEKYKGERVLIHSCNKSDFKNPLDALNEKQWKYLKSKSFENGSLKHNVYGAIIGSVIISDCVINNPSIWAQHSAFNWKLDEEGNLKKNTTYNWVLENPILFPEPIPAKGKLSFWDYPGILSETEEKGGELFCHCQLPVKEINQVTGGCGDYRCVYCGGKWYK